MNRVSFAYIVQLDLPGCPVKIGRSRAPRVRLRAFDNATPVAVRMVGITLNGSDREAEMLSATADTIIKGEWRYPNAALQSLVNSYHLAGEWFVMADNHRAHYVNANVAARIANYTSTHKPCPIGIGYHWSKGVLAAAQNDDPLLGVDWSGFVRGAPLLKWPTPEHTGKAA